MLANSTVRRDFVNAPACLPSGKGPLQHMPLAPLEQRHRVGNILLEMRRLLMGLERFLVVVDLEDVEDTQLHVSTQLARTRRGGSFAYEWFTLRSAHRGDTTYFPDQTRDGVGFRVARTMPPQ